MTSTQDRCLKVAGSVGKLWRRHRRELPSDVKDAMASLLLELRLHIFSPDDLDESCVGRARCDIRGVKELLCHLAVRGEMKEVRATSASTSTVSGSSGPDSDSDATSSSYTDIGVQTTTNLENTCLVMGPLEAIDVAFGNVFGEIEANFAALRGTLDQCSTSLDGQNVSDDICSTDFSDRCDHDDVEASTSELLMDEEISYYSAPDREDIRMALLPLASLPELVYCISSSFARLQGTNGQEEDIVECSCLELRNQKRYDRLVLEDFDMFMAVRVDKKRLQRTFTRLDYECQNADAGVESGTFTIEELFNEDDDGCSSWCSAGSVFAMDYDFVQSDHEGGNPRSLRLLRGSVQSTKDYPCGIVARHPSG